MVTPLVIWAVTVLIYGAFWAWYVGFGHKISALDLNRYMSCIEQASRGEEFVESYRDFFANDDGKEFFMVNVLHLKHPKRESAQLLSKYTSVFVPKLMRKAGHPYFVGLGQAKNLENLNCESDDEWTSIALMRYRSRKDLGEMLVDTIGQEHHGYKLAALEKTFAFPASAKLNLGSVRLVVALVLALIAASMHIGLIS